MSSAVRIVPWITGTSSLYAVERDGVCLPEEFLDALNQCSAHHAERLTRFLVHILRQDYLRPSFLRPELPELGIYAMYNHKELRSAPYNPSRLLCRYVAGSDRIVLVGSGFVKSSDEPIQSNVNAHAEAVFLSDLGRGLDMRIDCGEIIIANSVLVPTSSDSFIF